MKLEEASGPTAYTTGNDEKPARMLDERNAGFLSFFHGLQYRPLSGGTLRWLSRHPAKKHNARK